jgi:hypothetical protein
MQREEWEVVGVVFEVWDSEKWIDQGFPLEVIREPKHRMRHEFWSLRRWPGCIIEDLCLEINCEPFEMKSLLKLYQSQFHEFAERVGNYPFTLFCKYSSTLKKWGRGFGQMGDGIWVRKLKFYIQQPFEDKSPFFLQFSEN